MTSGFETLMAIDDHIIALYNFQRRLFFWLKRSKYKYNLEKNVELLNKHQGNRCFIIGNGPSIKTQDLTLLKNEWTFFCNHFYNHPQTSEINPKYYAIADPKLISGEWPTSMLPAIRQTCPEAKFLLSAHYQDYPHIMKELEDAEAYWLYGNQFMHRRFRCSTDLTRGLGGSTVVTLCVFAAVYMGFSQIYLLGVDCNGIFLDLVDKSSHFYKAEKENIGDNDPDLVTLHLRSTIQGFRGWQAIADTFSDSSCRIVNLTEGGLLNCFPRQNYFDLLRERTTC